MASPFNANSFTILNVGITAPGTAEQVAQHYVPDGIAVIVTARITNTDNMYVAMSQAAAQSGAREVFARGRSAEFWIDDTSRLWVDADNTGNRLEIRIPKDAD